MERIPTGILEFDALIEGGFPKGTLALVTGVPGSGKTIFCLQIARNLASNGKKVLYMSIDGEAPETLELQAVLLGMDIKPLLESKFLAFEKIRDIGKDFEKTVKNHIKNGVSCVILDSLSGAIPMLVSAKDISKYVLYQEETVMGILDPNFVMRRMISDIIDFFRNLNLDLVIAVTDRVEGQPGYSRDAVSEFIADSIIDFETLGIAGFSRSMRVLKLRKSKHYTDPVNFEIITGKGIIIADAAKK